MGARSIALLLVTSSAAAAGDRVVLLVENRSQNAAAPAEVQPAIVAALKRKGYEVVSGSEVEQACAAACIGHGEALPPAAVAQLLQKFQARRVVTVTIHYLLDQKQRSLGPRASPAVGLSARSFTAERLAWRNSLGMFGDSDLGVDQKKRKPLVAQASARLLWSFPRGSGAEVASIQEEWNEVTGYVPPESAASLHDYDVLIERLRSTRTGPRFRLKIRKTP